MPAVFIAEVTSMPKKIYQKNNQKNKQFDKKRYQKNAPKKANSKKPSKIVKSEQDVTVIDLKGAMAAMKKRSEAQAVKDANPVIQDSVALPADAMPISISATPEEDVRVEEESVLKPDETTDVDDVEAVANEPEDYNDIQAGSEAPEEEISAEPEPQPVEDPVPEKAEVVDEPVTAAEDKPEEAKAEPAEEAEPDIGIQNAVEGPEKPMSDDIPEVKLSIYMIHSDTELETADKANAGGELYEAVSDARDRSWLNIWHAKQDFVKAGVGQEGIIAIHGYATASQACRIKPEEFGNFTKNFMRSLFGDLNVLSCLAGETDSVYVHFLIYPLNIRQLNPNKWIEQRTGQFKREIVNDFVDQTGDKFGVNLNASLQLIGNGHTQYLDDKPDIVTTKSDESEIYYDSITDLSQLQTDWTKDKIDEISATTITYFTTGVEKASYIKLNNGDISLDNYLASARDYVTRMHPGISDKDLWVIIDRLESAAAGFYILDSLLDDEHISDIKICGPDKIRVKVEGQRRTSNLKFIDENDYYRFLEGILSRYKRPLDEQVHVFTDKTTHPQYILRNNITLGGINSDYPTYHIRKVPKFKYTINDLVDKGMMDRKTANYLIWAAREGKGMLFTGKGSSGKTTMMNTLIEYTPADASGIIVQESEELFSMTRPEMTFQHIWGDYDLKTLAKNALLIDIDYFIVGEIKGDESLSFITASNTGNKAWASCHGSSSSEAIDNLCHYIISAEGSKYSKEQAMYMLKDIQVVVFMKNWKVAEISEVVGWDPVKKDLIYKKVLRRDDVIAQRAH